MALDYYFNHTGLEHQNFDGSFITNFIFTAFLLLFTIPICVQEVTIYDRLHFHRRIHVLIKNFHRIFQTVLGLYQLAQECRSLQEPTLRTNQDFVQTSPLPALADLVGWHAGCMPPPMGPNSFVFAYIFTKKHLHQRCIPPLMDACPPYGKSWICHWPDELLLVLATRSILIRQPEESPLTILLNPQKTPVPQLD